jgi:ATP-dependent DNA helicase RecG
LLSRIQSFFDVYRLFQKHKQLFISINPLPCVALITVFDTLLTQPEGKTLAFKRDRELNLIEQWGSGVRRIFREALELGLPEPQFVELGLRVRLVVRLAQALPVVLPHPAELVPEKTAARLESRLESALAARVMLRLAEAEAGKAQLAQSLGHQTVSGELHKQVKRLLAQGYIEMTLPHKPNSRLQKYRLTPTGHALLLNQ